MSKRCETHKHGQYVTFPIGIVYHLASDDLVHTLCSVHLSHPHNGKNGTVIDTYIGDLPFPTFHQVIPDDKRICKYCQRKKMNSSA